MGKSRRTDGGGSGNRGLQQRIFALVGIVVIVGIAVGVLSLAGLLGNQGGGEGIEDVVIMEAPRAEEQEEMDVGPQVGKLAPDFEISAFDGTRHRLSDFRGTLVYLNFWATWCTPCVIELPEIQVLDDRHGDDLVVITVNRREPLDRAESFFSNLPREDGGTGLSFDVNGIDPDDTLYSEYRALGMPASFFIDRDGVITDVFNGIIPLETMEEAVAKASAGSDSTASR